MSLLYEYPAGPPTEEEAYYEQMAQDEKDAYIARYGQESWDAYQAYMESGGPDEPLTLGCYFCYQDEGGDVMEQDSSKLPQRKVVSERTVEAHRDPTACYELECGHNII